jgi:hypothetical protein
MAISVCQPFQGDLVRRCLNIGWNLTELDGSVD